MSEINFTAIDYIFSNFRKKEVMISYIKDHFELFQSLLEASLSLEYSNAWRSTLLVGHIMEKNDVLIKPLVDDFIEVLLKLNHDGHQRQVLIVLDKMQLNEEQEGRLFDKCMTLWEDIKKIPSTRIRAFWMLLKIAEPYPEIQQDIKHFTTEYYLKTLSPGIRVIIEREIKKINGGL